MMSNSAVHGWACQELHQIYNPASCQLMCGPAQLLQRADGRIKCWGLNDKGQLGLGNNLTIGLAASDMGDNVSAERHDRHSKPQTRFASEHLWGVALPEGCLECDASGRLPVLMYPTLAAGKQPLPHICLCLQLAYVDLGTGITATQIAMGPFHACALTTSGAVKCWGSNLSGELGHSANYSAWGRKPGQMGDALPVAPLNLQTPSGGWVGAVHSSVGSINAAHV
jgi:hypothetical protein